MSTTFYTYLYLRTDGTPYYAGKGFGRRAFCKGRNHHPPKDPLRIVIFPMESEKLAFESEKALIQLFGRKDNGTGILRNLTDGGEGAGCNPCLETRRKLSKLATGRVFSAEHRRKLSEARRRMLATRPFALSEQSRLKLSASLKRRKRTDSERAAGMHTRWHANRGISKPGCVLCQ